MQPIPWIFAALALLGGGCSFGGGDAALLQRGQEAYAAGAPREAMIHLKNFLRERPESSTGRALLGLALLELGEFEAAAIELSKASRSEVDARLLGDAQVRALLGMRQYEPALEHLVRLTKAEVVSSARLAQLQGEALEGLGRFGEARASYSAALQADPRHVAALLGLARIAGESGDAREAERLIEAALSLEPASIEAELLRGRLFVREGRFREARDLFASLAERLEEPARNWRQYTSAVGVLSGLAESEFALQDANAAAHAVKRLTDIAPASHAAVLLGARVDFANGRLHAARSSLEKLLNAAPDNPAARLMLSAVMLAEGNMAQADMHLSSLVASDPKNVIARRLLAEARLRERKPLAALEALKPVIASGEADATALQLAGQSALSAGNSALAVRYLEQGTRAGAGSVNASLALAAAHISAGNTVKALELLTALQASDALTRNRRDALTIGARIRSGERAHAIAAVREMLARSDRDTASMLIAVEAHLMLDDAGQARDLLDRELKAKPNTPELVLVSAALHLRAGEWDGAEQALRKYRELAPDSPYAALGFARLAAARGETKRALEWLQAAVREHPRLLEARLSLLQMQLAAKTFDAALETAAVGLEVVPDNAALLNALGISLVNLNRHAEAAGVFERLAGVASESPLELLASARGFASISHWTAAVDYARRAARLDTGDVTIATSACALIAASEDSGAASRCIGDLKKLAPQRASAWILEGDLAMRHGAYHAAALAYEQARTREASGAVALRLFEARRRAGAGLDAALDPLESFLTANPNAAELRLILAQQRLEHGHREAAKTHYEILLVRDPDHAISLNNLAWLYHESGDDRALALAERAYRSAPESGQIADTYGWLLLHSGELALATDLLGKAARALPESPEVQYHFAVALSRTGQVSEALQVLERILSSSTVSPSMEDARRLRGELSAKSG